MSVRRDVARSVGRPRTLLLVLLLLLLVGVAVDLAFDDLVRVRIEDGMNRALAGYSVTLDSADLRPWSFSLELRGLTVAQDAHPSPPVARFPETTFSVHWTGLLAGRLVGDVTLRGPQLHLQLEQLREELDDRVALDERGWQEALLAAYPLKVDALDVHRGALIYRHDASSRPLNLSEIELEAANIRNIRSPRRTYPSAIRGTARVFDHGSAAVQGHADFLAQPHAGVQAAFRLENVPLDRLDPVVRDVRLAVTGGRLAARGEIEIAPSRRSLHLERLDLAGVKADYLFDPDLTERALEAAKRIEREPLVDYAIDALHITDGELGLVDRRREPGYRLFLSDADLRVTGLRSRSEQVAEARLEALFMGSGETTAYGSFRPDRDGADFDVGVAIRGTELAAMNDLLRSWADLDVRDGVFSFYSELRVADGRIAGYLKPLFEDVDVYDPEQDRHKGLFHRIWEHIAEGLAELLSNRSSDEVATIADLQGSVQDPEASNWQVLVNLVRNAFVEAILPGFERRREE